MLSPTVFQNFIVERTTDFTGRSWAALPGWSRPRPCAATRTWNRSEAGLSHEQLEEISILCRQFSSHRVRTFTHRCIITSIIATIICLSRLVLDILRTWQCVQRYMEMSATELACWSNRYKIIGSTYRIIGSTYRYFFVLRNDGTLPYR